MRTRLRERNAPPMFKRPGGRAWFAYEDDVRAWLNSARSDAA